MAPEIGYYGHSNAFEKISGCLKQEPGTEVVLDREESLTVMIHRDFREPSVIYPLQDIDGYYVGFRIFANENVINRLEQDLTDLEKAF